MKNYTLFFLLILLLGTSFNLFSQTFTVSYQFDQPEMNTGTDGYTDVTVPGCRNEAPEGYPYLPLMAATVVLPPGTEIASVETISVTYGDSFGNITVRPASRSFPISIGAPDDYKPEPAAEIYNHTAVYPHTITDHIHTGFLCGHSLGTFSVSPVRYFPAEKKIVFIQEAVLEITVQSTEKAQEALTLLRHTPEVIRRIENKTKDTGFLDLYPDDKSKEADFDLLIITKQEFVSTFDSYIAYKTATGFATEIKTTESIYTEYTGADNPEKIRNCILDYFLNKGIGYVILAGDAAPNTPNQNIIPKKGLYANPGGGNEDFDIASDMYYSGLDGNWNADGDNKWGEPNEADLFLEVAVGRLCVDSQTELENMLNKLYKYQDAPVVADIEKALMVGEQLDAQTYGDDSKEDIVTGGYHYGYSTAPVGANFDITRLYESQGMWSKQDVYQAFSQDGTHLLNHFGHSNVDYNMKMDNGDVTTSNLSNNGITRGYVIGYSQGCYNGSFDNRSTGGYFGSEDCFAEKITTLATGLVAGVANSRYGWYNPGGSNGPSQHFDRQFFDAIFGEDIFLIGDVNNDSKEDNLVYIYASQVNRWCAYETNLFGDPTLDIWTGTPVNITAAYPASIPAGTSQIGFATNTPGSRIALMQNGILIGRGLANTAGNAQITLTEPVIDGEPVSVTITGHNRIKYEGTIQISPYTGIGDTGPLMNFSVFPNPVSGKMTVRLPGTSTGEMNVKIINMMGETVYSEMLQILSTGILEADVSGLSNGLYSVVLNNGGSSGSQKIVIQ